MLAAGATAPAFTLHDVSGKKHSLDQILARGPALFALFKVSCPVCKLTLPYLDRISGGSLQVIGISQDDARGTAQFQRNAGLTMPMLLDREEDGYPLSNRLGIIRVPSLFLVEPGGVISLATEGFVKRDLETIGKRAGIEPFRADENVPEWKAG